MVVIFPSGRSLSYKSSRKLSGPMSFAVVPVEFNWNPVSTISRATVSSSKEGRWVIRDIGALAVTVVTASLVRGEKLARQISWKIYT